MSAAHMASHSYRRQDGATQVPNKCAKKNYTGCKNSLPTISSCVRNQNPGFYCPSSGLGRQNRNGANMIDAD